MKQELYEGQGTKKGLHLVCGELMLLGLVEPWEDLMVSLEMIIFARNNPLLRFHWYD